MDESRLDQDRGWVSGHLAHWLICNQIISSDTCTSLSDLRNQFENWNPFSNSRWGAEALNYCSNGSHVLDKLLVVPVRQRLDVAIQWSGAAWQMFVLHWSVVCTGWKGTTAVQFRGLSFNMLSRFMYLSSSTISLPC